MLYKSKIEKLLHVMEEKQILAELGRIKQYSDEVRMIHYYAQLRYSKKNSDGNSYKGASAVSGISLLSKEQALLKCLMEAVERFSSFSYKNESIYVDNYDKILSFGNAFDPAILSSPKSKSTVMGWVMGENLTEAKKCFIPAQLIYLYYKKQVGEETFLFPNITTGTAAGFDRQFAILHGIYEVVERDAVMGIYLNKIKAPKIDLNTINNADIKVLLTSCERYNLELCVFNITTDIGIPTFMGILIDRTGVGPAITIGAKSSMNAEEALVGGVLETFLTRTWLRREIEKRKNVIPGFDMEKGNFSMLDRGLFWSSPLMIKELNFLLMQKTVPFQNIKRSNQKKSDMDSVMNRLSKKGFTVYGADITAPIFQKIGCFVYKIIIPGLQPLYLNEYERQSVVNVKRLKEIGMYFGKKEVEVNKIPHPFL